MGVAGRVLLAGTGVTGFAPTTGMLLGASIPSAPSLAPFWADMIELNQNEKYQDLPRSLPTRSSVPERIRCGDLMLYGTRTLVLFYKDFPTTYPYTRLGTITDTKGLREALGKGNVEVKLEK